ncbi:hypothetical protein ACHHYP_20058 [Achlya hypogyna]|uniref:Uncharacterized protein n=1 Tax=Achlya hypogyna TaxID=1202772 RepID=A0A1V9Z905_ACHHY|nr:hypothetical protein ACHHYP_20058 [Achlya hypogyna]
MARSVLTNDDLFLVTSAFAQGTALARWTDGDLAAALGHLYVLQHSPCLRFTAGAMDAAAANGHLAVVQWLMAHRPEDRSPHAMAAAAENNQLAVVAWLHAQGLGSRAAMDGAAGRGHLAMLLTAGDMDAAAEKGHLGVVQWLHAHRAEGCTTAAMDYAACGGHLDVVRWLAAERPEGCTSQALLYAAINGHLPVVQFLCGDPRLGAPANVQRAIHLSRKNGHGHVAAWLHQLLRRASLSCLSS